MTKIKTYRIAGPGSYTTGGFTFTATDFKKINKASITIENDTAGYYHITWTIEGNTITIVVSTISANTTTGAISASEVDVGTNLSGLYFEIVVEGV